MEYYTYAYLREDGTPYYIGKGKFDRVYRKRRKGVKPPEDKTRIIFLKQNLTEKEAFRHEKYMIAVFGRKDLGTGILHNRTDGGEGSSGSIRSEEYRKKVSEVHKGKVVSEEIRKKISEAQKGKVITEETRKKLSEAFKGKKHSEETKQKMKESHKGKTHTEKSRQKMRDAIKNRTASEIEQSRRKLSESRKGMKWWNDGCGNNKMSKQCPGKGWILGRVKHKTT